MHPILIAGIILVVVPSITSHEAAHGFVADRLGDPTAREAGRLTLNPIPHIDLFFTILLPAFLILSGSGFIFGGAKPVPIDVSRLRNPRRDGALVGAAGPLMNVLLAVLLCAVLSLLVHGGLLGPSSAGTEVLAVGIFVNILLAVFNFVPIPPLDGSRVVQYFLPRHALIAYQRLERFGLLLIVLLILYARPLQFFLFIVGFQDVGRHWSSISRRPSNQSNWNPVRRNGERSCPSHLARSREELVATNTLAQTRRRFMALGSAVLGSLIGAGLAIPLIGSFLGPALRKVQLRFTDVGPLPSLPAHAPAKLGFVAKVEDAYIADTVQRYVWVVSVKPAVGQDEHPGAQTSVETPQGPVTVFSPICPHLGCEYDWVGSQNIFYCPCHDSRYGLDGKVLGGPAPRPLDTLPCQLKNGSLHVQWVRFESGVPYKKVIG